MSPLDDQLRAALHARALDLAPSPDPLAGIESRARGMKRRRLAASVAGAVLAVSAIAVAVPSLVGTSPKPQPIATQGPDVASASALDPQHPWAFRGTPLTRGTADTFQREWAVLHPGSTLTVLFAQVYEPSGQEEAAFVATGGDGPRVGFVTGSEAGPAFRYDESYPAPATALQFALPGDEVPRLLVIASPDVTSVTYSSDGSVYRSIEPGPELVVDGTPQPVPSGLVRLDGIGITSLEGDLSKDRVRVTVDDGTVVYDEQARDPSGGVGPVSPPPTNLLASWPQRGDASVGPDEHDLLVRFAQAANRAGDVDKAVYRALFTGDTDSGVTFTVGQAWFAGDTEARSVALTTGRTDGPEFFYGPATASDAKILAFSISNLPGTVGELLVVVPQPRTGQVLYDRDATGSFVPVTGQDHLDGVVLIERTAGDTDDRLQLLDGNGDLDNPTYEGPVQPLLCGSSECG